MRLPPNHITAAAGILICLAGLASCTQPEPRSDSAPAGRSTARHALHSERLRVIMAGMGSQAAKTWPQEIAAERAADEEREQGIRFDQARQLAAALAQAAGQIPDAIAGAPLTEEQRRTFLANVDRLRLHAGELEASAARHDFDGMHNALHSVRTTCNSCHARFRELAGPVELPPSAL